MLMPLWKYLAEIGVSTELNSSLKKLVALKTTVAAEGKVDTRNNPAGMEVPYAYRNGLGVENIALGAERDGTVSLYCVSAKTANGEAMVKVYKGDHSPLSLNSGIKADPNSQSTLMRVPGSEREWYYFTLYQGKPYMHRIDEESGIKDANVLLDGKYESYGQTMALVSDYGNGPSKLLLRRYNSVTGNTHLVAFAIDKNGAGAAQALDSLSSIDVAGSGEIQISPELSKIAMVNTSKTGLIKKEQIVYWHFNTERTAATDRAVAVEQSYWSVFNKRKFNTIDFTGSGNFIYFVEMKSSSLTRDIKRQQIGGSLSTVTTITGAGDVRRGGDGKMYVAAGRYFYTITSPEGTPTSSSQVLANGYNSGAMAAQPIRIYLPHSGVTSFAREYGHKTYEIKDHLGNVRVTFTDVKNYDPVALSYTASLSSVNNYYAFGGLEYNKHYNTESYKFGFNGQEMDNEVSGTGNTNTAMFWEYDTRLGRRWNMDPKPTTGISEYACFGDNPVFLNDVFGDSTFVEKLKGGKYKVIGGNLKGDDNGIYLKKKNGYKLIGYSVSPESFYNSEMHRWMGVIDKKDNSGKLFLNNLQRGVSLFSYIWNARGREKYDFKRTNGTNKVLFDNDSDPIDYYRGMPLFGKINDKQIFASARDVGNIGAGMIAGNNGMSWEVARFGFDFYQGESETSSTQYAQRIGWELGYIQANNIVNFFYRNYPSYGGVTLLRIPTSMIITQKGTKSFYE